MYKFLLITLIYLLVFFPGGTIPLIDLRYKEVFFIALLFMYFLKLVFQRNQIKKFDILLIVVVLVYFFIVIFGALNGINGNHKSEYIISEVIALSLLILIFPFSDIERDKKGNFPLIKHYLISSVIVMIFYILIIFLFKTRIVTDWVSINAFFSDYGLGSFLPNGSFYRLFMKANFYVTISGMLLFVLFMKSRNKVYFLFFLLAVVVTYFTGARALMISLIVFCASYILLKSKKNFLIFPIIFTNLFIILIIGLSFVGDENMNSFRSINPFYDDGSNTVRNIQVDYINEQIAENIFKGRGLGASYEEIGRSNSIEMVYQDLINKLGIVGFLLIMFILFFMPAYFYYKKKGQLLKLLLFQLAVLMICSSNPYLLSSIGMLVIILVYSAIMNMPEEGDII